MLHYKNVKSCGWLGRGCKKKCTTFRWPIKTFVHLWVRFQIINT